MVISRQGDNGVSIKTKTETVTIGDGVQIGSFKIPGAGEYDVATIQCEAQNLAKATVYFIRSEELTVVFLSEVDTDVTKVDDASNTDILIVDLRSDTDVADLKSVLKVLEPGYLLLTGSKADASFLSTLGLPAYESSTLKVSRTSLPMEGTQLVPVD
ncbi:MAG: hypothetical protein WCO52_00015 [bacterium]